MQEDKTICPHCGKKMNKWRTPAYSTWTAEYFYVCFNDECSYYVRGWKHMKESMEVGCSYRHRLDPETGATGPLPVWSPDACKSDILPD
ncbi:MAG: ogr/Delta-like zinc finger family protein [Syntrophobacteraceae bacterium]|jgi:ssDNA-binding Zn-finger/Zn-ribbon topoisomerase 1|nr:ogr/Delta-like zinc finger family protein [Syntrophobacteraceae bacterium]